MQLSTALATLASTAVAYGNTKFTCPPGMSYCPWTKACSCEPGMAWDSNNGRCSGTRTKGAWPEPDAAVYAVSAGTELGTFCAASPVRIVKYDAAHAYCQAGLGNVAFCASRVIEEELASLGTGKGAEIDVEGGDIGTDLKNVCAGLSGLFLDNVLDAVALFNTNEFGLSPTAVIQGGGGGGGLLGGILDKIKGLPCLIGLGDCSQDCVSDCKKGCGNYLGDVIGGVVDGAIDGLVGFCVLPDLLAGVDDAGKVVSGAIEGLLCVVGNVLTSLLSSFDCDCQ